MLDYKVSYHYSTAAVSEELPYCFLKSPFSSQYKSISWGKQIFATRSDEDEIEKPFICKKRVPRVRLGTPGKVRAASSGHTLEAQQINKEEKNNKKL